MKKLNISLLVAGFALLVGFGFTSLSANSKCGGSMSQHNDMQEQMIQKSEYVIVDTQKQITKDSKCLNGECSKTDCEKCETVKKGSKCATGECKQAKCEKCETIIKKGSKCLNGECSKSDCTKCDTVKSLDIKKGSKCLNGECTKVKCEKCETIKTKASKCGAGKCGSRN